MRFVTKLGRATRLTSALVLLLSLAACVQPMAGDPGQLNAATPDRTAVISVMFDFDSHRIRPDYYGALDAVAGAMLSDQLAGLTFDVSGHTDRAGRFAYNVALSVLRARAVVGYLVARGVPRGRLRAQGFGYLAPLDPGDPYNPANRRVEVTSIR